MAEVREREETVGVLRQLLPPHLIRVVLECAQLRLEVMLVCKQFYRLQWRYYDHKVRLSWAYLCAVGKSYLCPTLPTNINWATVVVYQSHDRKRSPLGYPSSYGPLVLKGVQNAVDEMRYNYPVFVALTNGDMRMMKYFWSVTWFGMVQCDQMLRLAATLGNIEAVQYLLDQGVDIEGSFVAIEPPLLSATFYGNVQIVRYLLEKGANIDAVNDRDWTALHCAVNMGNLCMVQCLLDHGANTVCIDRLGRIPLGLVPHGARDRDAIIALLTQG